jgi:hypothetical protein
MDCREIAAAMALAISIALDPVRAIQVEADAAAAAPTEPTDAAPPSQQPPAPSPQPPQPPPATHEIVAPAPDVTAIAPTPVEPVRPTRARGDDDGAIRARTGIALGVTGSLGAQPVAAIGPSLGVRVRWSAFSLALETLARAQLATYRQDTGPRVNSVVYAGALVACGHVAPFAVCAVALGGVFEGASPDVALPRPVRTGYFSAGVRAQLEIPFTTRVSMVAWLAADIPVTRTILQVAGTDVWSAGPLAASAGIVAAARFP